jgi:uncharacterized protein (TIGR04255 family)
MNFTKFERVEYKHHILFEVVFQVRFPEIMRILKEDPVDFQEIVRKEGYPELVLDIPALPSNMPKEIEEAASTAKVFHFISEEKDWKISLAKDFIALTCNENYKNYADFRGKLQKALLIFSEIYEPSYFTRIGLRHKNIANNTSLPHIKQGIEAFIPEHIFPELATSIAENIDALQKITQFNGGGMKANVAHVFSKVSGTLKQQQFANEKSYIIDIDCFLENKTKEIENVLTKYDIFKRLNWNIFQWSITDALRSAMDESDS